MIGRALSHFRITAKLGEGGMGAVYQAEDTKLGREVAIKVLPEAFSADPDRLARFEREAKVLASLNHSCIAGIHEVGEAEVDGSVVHFLVMELAPGETLAEHLGRGRIPLAGALPIALQIAEAFEAAHERGIVHRDLKPANVMVDRDGRVKVLDFGLAKVWEPPVEPATDLTNSPTLTAQMTRAGVILGTAAYMSPEQARSRPVDRRADIWAFGCVVYEMLTGALAFGGDTAGDVLARILEREPDLDQLPEATPVSIRTLVRRCLAKDAQHRLHDMGDVRLEIEEVLAGSLEDSTADRPGGRRARAKVGAGAALLALGAASVAALLTWLLLAPGQAPERPRARLSLSLEYPLDAMEIEWQASPLLSIAPDGSALAYRGRVGETSQLYLLPMDGSASVLIPGTADARSPFFSPDGAWLGFVEDYDLKVVHLGGGAPITLGRCLGRSRSSWTAEGGIVFAGLEGIFRTGVEGGEPVRLSASVEGRFLKDPMSLPGGDGVLLASGGQLLGDSSRVEVLSVSTGERRVLIESGGSPSFVPSNGAGGRGYLVYALGGQLFAAPFDLDELSLTGPAVAVVDDVLMRPNGSAAQYTVSSTGILVYATEEGLSELVWVDDAGRAKTLSAEQRRFAMPRLSPDESRLAIEVHEVPHQIWLLDIEKDLLSRFTVENSNHYFAWHPDGQSILYTSYTGDGTHLLWRRVDSAEEPVTIFSDVPAWIGSLSQDGRVAAIHSGGDVFVLPLDGGSPPQVTGPPIPVATSRFDERDPWISPDGQCVVYN